MTAATMMSIGHRVVRDVSHVAEVGPQAPR